MRPESGSVRGWAAAAGLVALVVAGVAPVQGQVSWRDMVVTGGVAFEGYQGNLSAVTVPLVDSTEQAAAAVGEFGARGELFLINRDDRALTLGFDGGMRQFAATGFELRDYAPREWVGTVDLGYDHRLSGVGTLRAGARVKGRWVQDRPPMPLFIQPGYKAARGSLALLTRPIHGIRVDAELSAGTNDYRALDLIPQLDLLDRRSLGVEVGAEWGGQSRVRFFGAYRGTRYPHQGSFDPDDPFRRDRSLRAGATWTHQSSIVAQLGVEGTLNRSNSRRPEYDAVSVQALLSTPLPADLGLDLFATLTSKSYISETEFARLVPGEEADNASVVYVSLSRPLAPNLDGSVRVGWTRAETDIGDSYFQRFGATFFLHFRPWSR